MLGPQKWLGLRPLGASPAPGLRAERNCPLRPLNVSTLATYAQPIIGVLSVQAIDMGLVLRVLKPIGRPNPREPAGSASRIEFRSEALADSQK